MMLTTKAIREAAARLIEFSFDEIAEQLKVQTFEDRTKLVSTLRSFMRLGMVERNGSGTTYRYIGHMRPTWKNKMWRAMVIKERFTREDVVKLSGATRANVKKFVFALKRNGAICHISGQGYSGGLYRLADPDNAPLEPPAASY